MHHMTRPPGASRTLPAPFRQDNEGHCDSCILISTCRHDSFVLRLIAASTVDAFILLCASLGICLEDPDAENEPRFCEVKRVIFIGDSITIRRVCKVGGGVTP